MSYKYAIKYSTNNMVAKAYSEFTAKVSENYSRLMDMVNATIVNSKDAIDASAVANAIIAEYATYGYGPSSNVPTNDGIMRLDDFLTAISQTTIDDMKAIDNDAMTSVYDSMVTLTPINETSYTKSLNSLLQELNSTFHSIIVENAIGNAYTYGKDVAEKLSIMRDTVSQRFNSAYDDVSQTLTNAANRLKSCMNINDYINDMLDNSGISKAAADGTKISASKDVAYSGASPAAAFSWSTSTNALIAYEENSFKAMFVITKLMLTGLWKAGKSLFNKAKDYVIKKAVDPVDFEVLSKDGNNTFDSFYYSTNYTITADSPLYSKLLEGPIHGDLLPCEFIVQQDGTWSRFTPYSDITTGFIQVLDMQGITLDVSDGLLTGINSALSTSYSDLLEAAQSICSSEETTILDCLCEYQIEHTTFTYNVLYKVKPVSYKIFEGLEPDRSDESGVGYYPKTLIPIFDRMLYDPSTLPSLDGVSEANVYKDIASGCILTKLLLESLYIESLGYDLDTITMLVGLDHEPSSIISSLDVTSTITNYDFMVALTEATFRMDQYFDTNTYEILPRKVLVNGMLYNIFHDQDVNPFNYEFWPYSRNYVSWFDPSYRVISDAEHQDEFNNFVNTAIVVTVVAVITIAAFIKLKQAATQSQVEAMGKEWDVTEKAQKGTLTNDDIKSWKKSKRLANRSSFLVGNLTGAGKSAGDTFSSLNNYDQVLVDLSPVISLITGE